MTVSASSNTPEKSWQTIKRNKLKICRISYLTESNRETDCVYPLEQPLCIRSVPSQIRDLVLPPEIWYTNTAK